MWAFMEKDPAFKRETRMLTLDESRRKTNAQIKAIVANDILVSIYNFKNILRNLIAILILIDNICYFLAQYREGYV